ncbi:Arm DNA-binding domain-containing protein, partial [Citrobacter cronae]
LMAFGVYPETSLADARQKREEARRLVAAGVDPREH